VKKILLTSFAVFVLLLISLSVTLAQNTTQPYLDLVKPSTGVSIAPYQGDTFLGQNHSYSVVFRGNGEAIVSLRVSLGNSGDSPLKELNLRVPRVQASGIYVFQIFKEKQCVRYEQTVYNPLTRSYPTPVCAEYQEPNYYNDYYYYNAKYKKADYEYKNDTLTVKLPSPIEVGKSGAAFIYFRAVGYAKKDFWGAYNYTFETLQAEEAINSLNIGLSTDSDLFMKGVKGEVNYRFNDVAPTVMKLGVGGGESGVANSALDSYINQIGSGQIYKSASNLMPLESYKVEGSYAKSRGALYGKEILIGITSLLVVTALVIAAIVLIYRMLKKSTEVTKKEENLAIKEKPVASTSNGKMFATVTLIGFVVSLVMTVYTALVVILGAVIIKNVDYSYQSLIGIVLVIISILIYLLLVLAPGVLIGVKKGVGWGLGVVISIVMWLIFWVIIVFLGLFLFGRGSGLYQILGLITPTPMY
jgi:hypothetical protein